MELRSTGTSYIFSKQFNGLRKGEKIRLKR